MILLIHRGSSNTDESLKNSERGGIGMKGLEKSGSGAKAQQNLVNKGF